MILPSQFSFLLSLFVLIFVSGCTAHAIDREITPQRHVQAIRSRDVLPDEPHDYTFKEFIPCPNGMNSNPQPYFRFLILFKKHPNVTLEWFHQHWSTVHADITMASKNVGIQIIRYNQFHQTAEHKTKIAPLLFPGIEYAPYDGIAEFHAKDYEHYEQFLMAAFADPVVRADQQKFVDTGVAMHIMAGSDNLIFGSGIVTSGGTDGLSLEDSRLQVA